MIINTTESNENGLWWIKFFNLGMNNIREYAVHQVSCDQSGRGGGKSKAHVRSQGGRGVWRGAKSAHAILKQPLNLIVSTRLWGLLFNGLKAPKVLWMLVLFPCLLQGFSLDRHNNALPEKKERNNSKNCQKYVFLATILFNKGPEKSL